MKYSHFVEIIQVDQIIYLRVQIFLVTTRRVLRFCCTENVNLKISEKRYEKDSTFKKLNLSILCGYDGFLSPTKSMQNLSGQILLRLIKNNSNKICQDMSNSPTPNIFCICILSNTTNTFIYLICHPYPGPWFDCGHSGF